ncbi:hypothetical protein IFM89_008523 [Coptis chinensis]|uniref:BRF2-like C-terminal domain-containing protein n=1 Tax=Coptis chinensis TaxID=261450 RepID=A0A835LPS6_9MAGN|nr:hypothetical protein IFM89_008523 [Coptis chinensis]
MVVRVIGYLELELPEFDIVLSFERAIMVCHSFENVLKGDMVGKMIKQGRFLLNCAVKWFLTTGRQPVPVVVAVLIFVSELNGIEVSFDEVAKEMRAGVFTCRKRYKEIKEALVKVAQGLPWGKNVTDENIVKNAPGIIQYMEIKLRLERGDKRKFIEMHEFHMEEMVNECLRKETGFDFDDLSAENDSQYFEGETRNRISGNTSSNDMDNAKISQECLSNIYRNFLSENHYVKSVDEGEKDYRKKRKKEVGIQVYKDWWSGMSDMSQKLFLEEILEKDVGFNGLPPSFVAGELACKRRREKINAAKQRIDEIMQPPNSVPGDKKSMALVEGSQCRKRRKQREKIAYIDWEDCIIETLLLHHVKEEEIEQGHYKRMLDLYVFDSERTSVKEQSVLRQKSSLLVDVPAYTTEVFSGYMWDYCILCRVYEGLAAVFGNGLSTACVVNMGAQMTSIICVEDGVALPTTGVNLSFGGEVPPMGVFYPRLLVPDEHPPPAHFWFLDYEDMLEDTWHMEFPRRPDMPDGLFLNANGGLSMWDNYPVLPTRLKKDNNLGLEEAITSSILSTGRIDLQRKLFCSIHLIGGVALTGGLVAVVEDRLFQCLEVLHAIPSNEAVDTVEQLRFYIKSLFVEILVHSCQQIELSYFEQVLPSRTDPTFVSWRGGSDMSQTSASITESYHKPKMHAFPSPILAILDIGREAWIHQKENNESRETGGQALQTLLFRIGGFVGRSRGLPDFSDPRRDFLTVVSAYFTERGGEGVRSRRLQQKRRGRAAVVISSEVEFGMEREMTDLMTREDRHRS